MTTPVESDADVLTSAEAVVLTDVHILNMTVAQLTTALQDRGLIPAGKRKSDLQIQLIASLKGAQAVFWDAKDNASVHSSRHPHSVGSSTSHSPVKSPELATQNKNAVQFELHVRLKELELEEQRMKMEMDDRRLRAELELEERKAERAHQLALRQLELNLSSANIGPLAANRTNFFRVDTAIKLVPRFNENDVESFLIGFEKIAQLNAWPEDKYTAILQAHLTGKALKVFTELSLEQCKIYQTLKAALLTAYAIVPEVHRKRFRTLSKLGSETFSEFAFRLSTQFKRWSEGEGSYSDVVKLREMIQLEQFREALDPELVIWLIDQKPQTVAQAAQLADQFFAVRKSVKQTVVTSFSRSPVSNFGPGHFQKPIQQNASVNHVSKLKYTNS